MSDCIIFAIAKLLLLTAIAILALPNSWPEAALCRACRSFATYTASGFFMPVGVKCETMVQIERKKRAPRLTVEYAINRLVEIQFEIDNKIGNRYPLLGERRRMKLIIANAKGSHTLKQAIQLIEDAGGVCANCGTVKDPTIDHIVPISKGGSNGMDNLQILCGSCNAAKGNKSMVEFSELNYKPRR